MPGSPTFNWGQLTITVAQGETAAVTSTATMPSMMSYYVGDTSIATATPNSSLTSWTIQGVSPGTTTVAISGAENMPGPLTITVTAPTPADDQNFLNERGLAHFWDNINSAMGWKCLGCAHTETATNQLDFTLPAQYDNYKIIASSVISTNATNGAWQTLSPLNGSTLLNFSGFLEKVEGTNWSCEALTSKDYVSQNTTYPYFSVFHEVLSMRSMSSETRHYMTTSVSGGGSSNGRTTRGNFHGVVSTEPTGFRLRMASNYIRSGSIYVWGMNNPT